jgi:hypothetical protein
VFRLHATIFQGYRDWCRHVDLPERIPELALEELRKQGEAVEWEYLLEELALYFLMYSEGANLRHTPEALWFIFWCLRNSYDRQLQITVPPPSDPRSAAKVACTPELARDLMKQRIHLRSKYQRLIADLRQEHGVKADGEMRTVSELTAVHSEAKKAILESGAFEAGRSREVNMVAEMVAYGDSGSFLDKVRSRELVPSGSVHPGKDGWEGGRCGVQGDRDFARWCQASCSCQAGGADCGGRPADGRGSETQQRLPARGLCALLPPTSSPLARLPRCAAGHPHLCVSGGGGGQEGDWAGGDCCARNV